MLIAAEGQCRKEVSKKSDGTELSSTSTAHDSRGEECSQRGVLRNVFSERWRALLRVGLIVYHL